MTSWASLNALRRWSSDVSIDHAIDCTLSYPLESSEEHWELNWHNFFPLRSAILVLGRKNHSLQLASRRIAFLLNALRRCTEDVVIGTFFTSEIHHLSFSKEESFFAACIIDELRFISCI